MYKIMDYQTQPNSPKTQLFLENAFDIKFNWAKWAFNCIDNSFLPAILICPYIVKAQGYFTDVGQKRGINEILVNNRNIILIFNILYLKNTFCLL